MIVLIIMKYTFELIKSGMKKISKTFDFAPSTNIKDVKLEFIGPIINQHGYDKIKFFQDGKTFDDSCKLQDMDHMKSIIIFPMNMLYKSILMGLFDSSEIPPVTPVVTSGVGGSAESKVMQRVTFEHSSKSDDEDIAEVEEEEADLKPKTIEEIMAISNKTLSVFNQETHQLLLKLFYFHRDDFMDFIDYISNGSFIPIEKEYDLELSDEYLLKVKTTFPFYEESDIAQIRNDLQLFGGNLNILVAHKMSSLLET